MQLTQAQYAGIAAACDRLLRAPETCLARLAVPALHFLNEHPGSLDQYAPVLEARSGRRFAGIPGALVRAVRGLIRSGAAPRPAPRLGGAVDVVIVSHLIRAEQLAQDDDFYFGALQPELQARGASSMLVWVNHLRSGFDGGGLPSSYPRMILPTRVPPAMEAGIWRQCWRAWHSLRREAERSSDSIERRLAVLASRQVLAAPTVTNLRMQAALAAVFRALDPRMVITTYEGTVAERLIWHAARSGGRRPLCVGYQHALMLERAHAIRRAVAAPELACDPDVVLTLGAMTHAALSASPELASVRFIAFGSHRHRTLAPLPPAHQRPRRCLVLPDAAGRECSTLFEFALRCADHAPDIGFVLRPHPMVDVKSLLRRHPRWRRLPGNVVLSTDQPLEQEFAQARYCLYRGSSAALYAARAGIRPFYVAQPGELSFDCLAGLGDGRETVTSPAEFAARVRVADAGVDPAAAARVAMACDRYVSPLRPAALDELLAMAPS